MALIYCQGDSPHADATAKATAEVLALAYPNHSWWIEVKQGVLLIKHFGISGKIGMVKHLSNLAASASAAKRDVLTAAGELLERAGLARRDYRGEVVEHLELDAKVAKHWSTPMKMRVIH